MNSGNPHLSLTLSPPIGWERRGDPSWARLRRDRQQVDAGRRLNAAQDEAGFGEGGCRIYPAFRFLRVKPADPHLSLTLSPPIGWERRGNPSRQAAGGCHLSLERQGICGGFKGSIREFFRANLSPSRSVCAALRRDRGEGGRREDVARTFHFQLSTSRD